MVWKNHDEAEETLLGGDNPQDGDSAFRMDDDFMQAGVADLSACFNEELLNELVSKRASKSKFAMEAGSIWLKDIDN